MVTLPGQTESLPHVVCLQEAFCELPKFDVPHIYTGYRLTSREQVAARLKDATVAITCTMPILPSDLDLCPNLKCVMIWATGYGWVDKEEYKKRGLTVMNTPQTNVETVSEHTLALYFASRRKIVDLHQAVMHTNEWPDTGTMIQHFSIYPTTASMETMVIFGYGSLGKRIKILAKALGMEVLVAERRGCVPREGRIGFDEGLKLATVAVVTVPKENETINMIDEKELQMMRNDSILINVARGGIINEWALAKALKEGWIAGAATDVFEEEPAVRGHCPLIDETIPNLTVTPHLAWYSGKTIENLQRMLKEGIEGYIKGKPLNVVVQG